MLLPVYRSGSNFSKTATNFSFETSPKVEARVLLPLLKSPERENVESVRRLIQLSVGDIDFLRREHPDTLGMVIRYRQKILIQFDQLIARRVLAFPSKKKGNAARRRRASSSYVRHGRARVLSDAEINVANEALRSGARWKDVATRFSVSKMTLLRYCEHRKRDNRTVRQKTKSKPEPFTNWRHWSLHAG